MDDRGGHSRLLPVRTDERLNAMSPRDLRTAIAEGRWTAQMGPRSLPAPPPEWSDDRRKRLAVAIRCASLFLFYKADWQEIRKRVGMDDRLFPGGKVTKQRVAQYITRGMNFLLSRGVFEEVPSGGMDSTNRAGR